MKAKMAFIFPGQGAQYVGMGRDIYENFKTARDIFEEASDLLGYSMYRVIMEGSLQELTETRYCQVAIFTLSIAIQRVFSELYPQCIPYACAGLSLGEYSALCASGRIHFKEGLKLVDARARYMQEASMKYPGGLSVVLGLDAAEVEAVIQSTQEPVWIANLNCPKQVVISGSHQALKKIEQSLKIKGAKRVIDLDVSGAFHSGLMKEASEYLKPLIEQTCFYPSSVKMMMNVVGENVDDEESIKTYLTKQVYSTTYWEKSIRALERDSIDLYIEMGPSKTLCGMNKKIGVKAQSFSIENEQELILCGTLLEEIYK